MGKIFIKYLLMFAFVVLVQILLLNQIKISGFLNPFFYVLFILLLPISTPRYLVILLSFLLGLTIDIFSDTLGLHMAASVLMGYLRVPVMNMISGRESELSDYPSEKNNGFRWFVLYVATLVLFHHFFLFYLEVFSFSGFFRTLFRVFSSSILSVFIIVLSQFLIFRE